MLVFNTMDFFVPNDMFTENETNVKMFISLLRKRWLLWNKDKR